MSFDADEGRLVPVDVETGQHFRFSKFNVAPVGAVTRPMRQLQNPTKSEIATTSNQSNDLRRGNFREASLHP